MNILDFLRLLPVLNNLYFVIRRGKTRRRKDISQILYQLRVKFIFLCFGIKTSLVEMLEYFFNIPVVFRHVVWVDKYIIQIDYDTNIQKIRKDIVYESLKSHRCCGNHQTQSPIATQASKALSRQSSGENHKRTQQGVSAKLESYIYRIHMVYAISSCLPHFLLKATMLYTCVLTSSSRSFYYILGLWRLIM